MGKKSLIRVIVLCLVSFSVWGLAAAAHASFVYIDNRGGYLFTVICDDGGCEEEYLGNTNMMNLPNLDPYHCNLVGDDDPAACKSQWEETVGPVNSARQELVPYWQLLMDAQEEYASHSVGVGIHEGLPCARFDGEGIAC